MAKIVFTNPATGEEITEEELEVYISNHPFDSWGGIATEDEEENV